MESCNGLTGTRAKMLKHLSVQFFMLGFNSISKARTYLSEYLA